MGPNVFNINTAQVSEHERILKACYDDLIVFGKLFLPGDFLKSKTPLFHYEIGEELISDSNSPCAIIIARGHAKTTLIKAKIIRDFCYSKKAKEWGFADKELYLFYGWVSSNQKKSMNNVKYVKLHLEWNDKINFYFGKEGKNLRGNTWNQEDITTIYDDRLISSSNLTSMRGDTMATIHGGAVRYSGVFVDDAENEENTRTQQSRDKIVDNIMNGILPAIEKNDPGCRLFLVETPVHWDAFAQNILDSYAKAQKEDREDKYPWKVITYSATQPDMPGGVLWESYMPRKKLEEIKHIYAESPRGIDGYYQEYELQVQSGENALWTRKHIKHYSGNYVRIDGQNTLMVDGTPIPINTFLGCDPATDIDTKAADFSVIMVIGIDQDNNLYVLDYERHRSIPTSGLRGVNGELIGKAGVVDYIIELYQKYRCLSGTVEDVTITRSVFQDLNSRLRDMNYPEIIIIPEKPGGRDKVNRIYSGLNSRFSNGSIYVKPEHHDLINEIVKFGPKMAHDDTIETLYYATRYCYPPKFSLDKTGAEVVRKRKKVPRPWIAA
jgi:hypothetical protein